MTFHFSMQVVQAGNAEWKYYRHHKSSFLELGLVKVAFLWELVSLGYYPIFIYPCIHVSIYASIYQSIYPSSYLPTYLSIYLSLSICLSV